MNYDPDLTKRDALTLALMIVCAVMGVTIGLIFGCRC